MLKTVVLATGTAFLAFASPTLASAQDAKVQATTTLVPAPVDSARLAIAQKAVAKLIPPGTYKRVMKDVMDGMANGLIEQMMGMDASSIAAMAGAKDGSTISEATKGTTIGELAAQKDPNFKERMDITFKVMFSEMGTLMTEMEPVVRDAMAKIYARKYSVNELNDMNTFFGTPSGSAFANNFMATFTDKEMVNASFGMMPKVLEAMPAIMKKVEAATAHLPPIPKADVGDDMAAMAADADGNTANPYANETGDEPWYVEGSWTPAQRKIVTALNNKYNAASDKSTEAFTAYDSEYNKAVDAARAKLKPEYDKLPHDDKPMAAEDITANAAPPPVLPNQ